MVISFGLADVSASRYPPRNVIRYNAGIFRTPRAMADSLDRIYTIWHHGDEFYVGRAGERQVLVASSGFGLAAVFFDSNGTLVEIDQRQFPIAFPKYYEQGYGRAFRQEMQRYADDIVISRRTIHIRRFVAPTVGFEIEDPAFHIAEALQDLKRGSKPAAELAELAKDVARWEAEGLFVLRLDGRELWLDGQGEIHST